MTEFSNPAPRSRGRYIAMVVAAIAFIGAIAGVGAWNDAHDREAQASAASALAEMDRQAEQARQAGLEQIARATPEQLTDLVQACQDSISDKLDGPFDVYFGRYTAHDLEPMLTSATMGAKIGRPSVVLDRDDFDPIADNVAHLQDPDWRQFGRITFTVEGAAEGFSIQHFVAVWECGFTGLTADPPREVTRVYYD